MWDPATDSWSTMAPMSDPRLYHSVAVLLPDARVLVGGGDDNSPSVEFYSPPYLFKTSSRPTITAAPESVGYGETFFVETPDFESIDKERFTVANGFRAETSQRHDPAGWQGPSDGRDEFRR